MHFLDHIGTWGIWAVQNVHYIIPFLLVLTVIVFFHELGHFLVARWCGVKVLTFSVGFGPELLGYTDRHGTRWKIAAVPLGGYVKFFGDENAASAPDFEKIETMNEGERGQSLFHKPVSQRAAIIAAGPIANFLLAIVIYAGIFMVYGKEITAARVDAVLPDSAAAAAGFKPGDTVLAINGRTIDSFTDMQRIVSQSAGDTIEVLIERDTRQTVLKAVPTLREIKDSFGNTHRVGVLGISRSTTPGEVRTEKYGPVAAFGLAVRETWGVVDQTLFSLYKIVVGRESSDQLGGPIRIAQVSAQAASISLSTVINLAAFLSVSIGFFNLFPIPLLDGGHLLFQAIEVVRGRPLSERAQEIGFRIGLAIMLMLMLFATYNDIHHLTAS
jgi:regulator of sigma E protease